MSNAINLQSVLSAYSYTQLLSGGRNSAVYLVEESGQQVVLKFFAGKEASVRFRRELASYQFLTTLPTRWTPELLFYEEEELYLKLAYIPHQDKSQSDLSHELTEEVLAQLYPFFEESMTRPVSEGMPLSADPALNLDQFLRALAKRLEVLMACHDVRLHRLLQWVQTHIKQLQSKSSNDTLPLALQRWVPADFSLQNVLMTSASKRPVIVDFEFAGRDDPARLLADWIWHPAQRLTEEQIIRVEAFFMDLYSADASFIHRYQCLKLACGLRWVLILLNAYLPSYRQQRPWLAEQMRVSWQELETQQLIKAEQFKQKLEKNVYATN